MKSSLASRKALQKESFFETKTFSNGSIVDKGRHRFALYLAFLLLVACCLTVHAQPQTFTVTTLRATGPGSLATSIALANTNAGAQIVFAVQGTITNINSFPTITNNLSIIGPSNDSVTISGGGTLPIFTIASGGAVTLSNLNLINGSTTSGGAAVNNAGVMSIANCLFSNNFATSGGAISNAGTMTIAASVFASNQASNGGAVWNAGTMAIQQSTFSNNLATLGFGGGILNSSSLQISASTFFDNQAVGGEGEIGVNGGGGGLGAGGAVFISYGNLAATNCTFSGNQAIGGAGGVALGNGLSGGNGGGNNGAYGGAVAQGGGDGGFGGGGGGGVPLRSGGSGGFGGGNGGLSNEDAGSSGGSGFGGGLFVERGNVFLVNDTIANNSTTGGSGGNGGSPGTGAGGGIYNLDGTVSLLNMIVASNSATTSSPDLVGTFVSSGFNLIGNSQGAINLSPNDFQDVPASLEPLQNNGGPTLTFALLANSLAISSGTVVGAPLTDQRGIVRPAKSDDMGAFQTVNPAMIVIGLQPQGQTDFLGGTATFTVLAGGPGPLNCQWMEGSGPLTNGSRISVSTTSANVQGTNYSVIASTLTITNLQSTDPGSYFVIISNASSTATSSNAVLALGVPLTIQALASPTIGGGASGGGSYGTGSSVTVTATPNTCYEFVNWTDGETVVSASPSYTFTLAGNQTLTANFSPIPLCGANIITVTSTADNGNGTLRDALVIASSGDTINFSVTTPTTITLTTGELVISRQCDHPWPRPWQSRHQRQPSEQRVQHPPVPYCHSRRPDYQQRLWRRCGL